MGKINMGRVLLGGLLAGVVLYVGEFALQGVALKGQWDAAMHAMGKTMAMSPSSLMLYALWSLLVGIMIVWFYAAARPRFGAGAGTAARIGLALWAVGSLGVGIGYTAGGLLPNPLIWCGVVGELLIYVIAAVVGAWPYQEA
jgi:hypothetical protein